MRRSTSGKGRVFDKIESLTKITSAIAIPIVLAIVGWMIQASLNKQSLNKDYVTLAISILQQKPENAPAVAGLRTWAVEELNHYSEIKFDEATAKQLESGNDVIRSALGAPTGASRTILTAPTSASLAALQQNIRDAEENRGLSLTSVTWGKVNGLELANLLTFTQSLESASPVKLLKIDSGMSTTQLLSMLDKLSQEQETFVSFTQVFDSDALADVIVCREAPTPIKQGAIPKLQ